MIKLTLKKRNKKNNKIENNKIENNKIENNKIENNKIENNKNIMIGSIIKLQSIIRRYLQSKKYYDDIKEYIKFNSIYKLIKNNIYVKNCKNNKNKEIHSLSYLIKREMSQSDSIKLGNGIEKVLSDIIMNFTNLENIKSKNNKGKKEKDHLFCDNKNKIIYYAELKCNINLDTEKSKSTYTKCLDIVDSLKKEYPNYNIKWALVACRYTNNNIIPSILKNKYKEIKNNLFGINDYFHMLGIEIIFNDEKYCEFLNMIADEMFNNS